MACELRAPKLKYLGLKAELFVMLETSLLGSGECLTERLRHWGLERLVLQKVTINRLGRPSAVLLDMVKRSSGPESRKTPPLAEGCGGGGIMLV